MANVGWDRLLITILNFAIYSSPVDSRRLGNASAPREWRPALRPESYEAASSTMGVAALKAFNS